jgi:polysaccharide biosynthesis protein PslA
VFENNSLEFKEKRSNAISRDSTSVARTILYCSIFLIDLGLILDGFWISSIINHTRGVENTGPIDAFSMAIAVFGVYLLFSINLNSYAIENQRHFTSAAKTVAVNMAGTMFLIVCILYLMRQTADISRFALLGGAAISTVLMIIARFSISRYIKSRPHDRYSREIIICDGVNAAFDEGSYVIDATTAGISPDLNDPQMLIRLGSWLRAFDRAIVACPSEKRTTWALLLQGANVQGEVIANILGDIKPLGLSTLGKHNTLVVCRGPLRLSHRIQKRIFDLSITIPLIILLTPFWILAVVLIKIDSKGPVIFRQQRIGRGNRLFEILKFRTMKTELSDLNGSVSTQRNDPRVTRVGNILRKTSVDELPQLFNVLKGDMSLVGPRPHAVGSTVEDLLFWEVDQKYWMRHSLKPGITGLAQVHGFRGSTEKKFDLEMRLKYDLEYIENWSIFKEFMILIGTAGVVLHKNTF